MFGYHMKYVNIYYRVIHLASCWSLNVTYTVLLLVNLQIFK